MPRPRIFSKRVFKRAKELPDILPEPFRALEEYDNTRILRRWDSKVRVNFTLSPELVEEFRSYCGKKGYKMSTLLERLIGKELNKHP